MIVHIFDYTTLENQDLNNLLVLFRNSVKKSDYMAFGEVDDTDTLRKILSNKNLIHFFGYDNNVPIAYCQITYKAESLNFKSGAKINALSVHPEKRGKGFGKKILQEAITELQKNKDIKNIYLDVVKDNTIAINLYKELGFKKVGELKSIFTKDNAFMDIEIYSLLVNQ